MARDLPEGHGEPVWVSSLGGGRKLSYIGFAMLDYELPDGN